MNCILTLNCELKQPQPQSRLTGCSCDSSEGGNGLKRETVEQTGSGVCVFIVCAGVRAGGTHSVLFVYVR